MKQTINVIQVDDSIDQLKRTKNLLSQFENVELLAQFDNAEQALLFINETDDIDIAFFDVELRSNDGLWLAHQVKNKPIHIVFITAHADYALKAFEVSALDYILKPVNKENITEVLNRYQNRLPLGAKQTQVQSEGIEELVSNYKGLQSYPKRVFINNLHKTTIVRLDSILYLTSKGAYTEFNDQNGDTHISSKHLKFYDEILESHPDFIRIHRAYIINLNFVKALLRDKNSMKVLMENDEKLEISPLKKDEILIRLEAKG